MSQSMPTDNVTHLATDPPTTEQRVRVLEVHHRVLAEQMAELSVVMQDIKTCLQRGDSRMGGLEHELSKNSTTTTEVREILDTARAGLHVLGGIGTLVRWAGYLAAAGAALYTGWYMLTHGGKPPGAA